MTTQTQTLRAITQPVPQHDHDNAFTYVLNGKDWFGADKLANAGQMVLFAQDGNEVAIANLSTAESLLDVLLIAGVPLNEPVVRYGSFVMNTEAEIYSSY